MSAIFLDLTTGITTAVTSNNHITSNISMIQKPQLLFGEQFQQQNQPSLRSINSKDSDTNSMNSSSLSATLSYPAIAESIAIAQSRVTQFNHMAFSQDLINIFACFTFDFHEDQHNTLYINTLPQLQNMIENLKKQAVICWDVHYNTHRSFQGYICFIELSSMDCDYIVDCLVLRSEINRLSVVLNDESIMKVSLNQTRLKVEWLYKDFNLISLTNSLDLSLFLTELGMTSIISYLSQTLLDFPFSSLGQSFDFRKRPVSLMQINYLRAFTYFPLRFLAVLADKILALNPARLQVIYENSQQMSCLNIKTLHSFELTTLLEKHFAMFTNEKIQYTDEQTYFLRKILKWRLKRASLEDESVEYIFPACLIEQFIQNYPKSAQQVAQELRKHHQMTSAQDYSGTFFSFFDQLAFKQHQKKQSLNAQQSKMQFIPFSQGQTPNRQQYQPLSQQNSQQLPPPQYQVKQPQTQYTNIQQSPSQPQQQQFLSFAQSPYLQKSSSQQPSFPSNYQVLQSPMISQQLYQPSQQQQQQQNIQYANNLFQTINSNTNNEYLPRSTSPPLSPNSLLKAVGWVINAEQLEGTPEKNFKKLISRDTLSPSILKYSPQNGVDSPQHQKVMKELLGVLNERNSRPSQARFQECVKREIDRINREDEEEQQRSFSEDEAEQDEDFQVTLLSKLQQQSTYTKSKKENIPTNISDIFELANRKRKKNKDKKRKKEDKIQQPSSPSSNLSSANSNSIPTPFVFKNKNFEEFIEKSLKSLREEGVKFEQQKQADSNAQSESQRQEWDEKLAGLEGLFKMFCVLKGQKRKKSRTNNAVCSHVYGKNLLSRAFDAWKRHQQFSEYLSRKYEEAEVKYNRSVLTRALRSWQDVVIQENKTIIKNTTLKKTEMELQKSQREFESQIKSLEILLQQKLLILKHEEQQYELLCQKQQILAPTQKLDYD